MGFINLNSWHEVLPREYDAVHLPTFLEQVTGTCNALYAYSLKVKKKKKKQKNPSLIIKANPWNKGVNLLCVLSMEYLTTSL